MRNRFFVFSGPDYSERGGWRHFKRRFDDREKAMSYAIGLLGGNTDGVQVVDIMTNKMVEETVWRKEV